MPRIQPVNVETVSPSTTALFGEIRTKLGKVPNIVATMANSVATFKPFLAFSGALEASAAAIRVRIALETGFLQDESRGVAGFTVPLQTELSGVIPFPDFFKS